MNDDIESRSWTEDYSLENGNYGHTCPKCGERFNGHKRRFVCKPCAATGKKATEGEIRAALELFSRESRYNDLKQAARAVLSSANKANKNQSLVLTSLLEELYEVAYSE